MGIRIDLHEFQILHLAACQRIEFHDGLDLVAEEADAPGAVFIMGGEEFDGVAAHAEHAAREIAAAALVLQGHEIGEQLALVDLLAHLQGEGHGRIGLDRTDAVDAGHGGHDDDVVALQQGAGGRMAHAVDLLVDGAFFLDIGVGPRHIGLGLVVIVVGDEIFDGVVGEEGFELPVKLRRQRLVGRQNQGGPVGAGDHLRHGEGLARAGHAQQHLIALMLADGLHQFPDGAGLVALGLIFADDLEGDAALGLVRARRTMGRPGLALAQIGVALLQQGLQAVEGGRGPGDRIPARAHPAHLVRGQGIVRPAIAAAEGPREGFSRLRSLAGIEARLRRLLQPGTPLVQGGVEQGGQMLPKGMHVGPGGLGAGGAGGVSRGFRHRGNMG